MYYIQINTHTYTNTYKCIHIEMKIFINLHIDMYISRNPHVNMKIFYSTDLLVCLPFTHWRLPIRRKDSLFPFISSFSLSVSL